jgi:hypothetical protein
VFTNANLFKKEHSPVLTEHTLNNVNALCQVADKTKHYLDTYKDDHFAVHPGKIIDPNISLQRVKQTLRFICDVVRSDNKANRESRLLNREFLLQHFDFYRWTPDINTAELIAKKSTNKRKQQLLRAIPSDQLLLTKYYTKQLVGSAVKTQKYNQALYALPYDEQGKTAVQAEQLKDQLTRFKYTRQQVINGVLLQKKLAKPLVWLTEEDLHDVLLQGTGVLNVDGVLHYYNVHRNNGIAYNYSIGKREQARYWYFAEVPAIMGYGKTLASKIAIQPQAALAGNVRELGIGKLIMLQYQNAGMQENRMAILADQGGAFDNNLFQLDLLVGSYLGWDDYHQANKQLADFASAWIMLIKLPNTQE